MGQRKTPLLGRELLALLQSGSQLIRITQGSAALTLGCPITPLRG
jgi:hypothetical protein